MDDDNDYAAAEAENLKIAEHFGLSFHISAFNFLETHAGHKSEERRATEEELEMWYTLKGIMGAVLGKPPV